MTEFEKLGKKGKNKEGLRMNITKNQFKTIEDTYYLLAACACLDLLPDDSMTTIVNLRSTLNELKAKMEGESE